MSKTYKDNPDHWSRKDKSNRFNKKNKRKREKHFDEENQDASAYRMDEYYKYFRPGENQ